MIILETERLILREIEENDYKEISLILQDIDIMYAWEHGFSNYEVEEWINENLIRYKRDGYSYWAVIEKQSGKLIGVTGLIAEQADEENYIGIGYIYNKLYWKKGYALEAATACMDYGMNTLRMTEITAQIRLSNITSVKLAKKLGMVEKKRFVKRYKGKDMLHILYVYKK